MDITQLRYFVAASEAGSISRGARRVGVAQPSLSQQIRRLEESLGVRLFDRLGRGVALTDEGEALLPRARRVLAEVAEAEAAVRGGGPPGAGRLSIGAIPTIAPYLLPSLLAALRREAPAADYLIREDLTENLVDAVVENEIDVAIVSTPIEHPLIDVDVIGREPMLAVAPSGHPLVRGRSAVGVADLRDQPAVTLHEMHCLGRQIDAFCVQKRVSRRIVCRTAQLTTVLELVRRGAGVSIVPEMASRYDAGVGVVFLPIKGASPHRDIALAWRVGRTRPALGLRARAILRDSLGNASPEEKGR